MTVNNRSDRLLRLLLPLHEAPHATEAWSVTLSGLSRLIRCEQIGVVERERGHAGAVIGFGAGSDERFCEEYRSYAPLDPFATEAVQARLLRGRRAMALDQLVDRQLLDASAFYKDYWRRYNVHDGLAAGVRVTGRRSAVFAALHSRGRELSSDDRALFDLFVGHARAALRQRHATAMRDSALRGLLDATDCLADAVFVVDSGGVVVQSNAAADDLIARGDVVRLRGGELRLGNGGVHDPLAGLLGELAAPRPVGGDTDPIRCLALREEGSNEEMLATVVRMGHQPAPGAPAGILFLRRSSNARPSFREHHLRDLFDFTPAESRIANALVAGERVEEIATRAGVRADTVRGHVKRMLAKTGARRQSDLVCRLASAVPGLRAFAPAA